MLAGNDADQELLLTLQKQLAVYQGLLTAAINRKDTANVIAGLTKQRDNIKQQISNVSYALAHADQPSDFLKHLDETAQDVGSVFKFGGGVILPLALIAAMFYLARKR